jgi:serine/threonine protein kinase
MSLIDGNIYAIKIIDKSKQPPKYIKREVKANQILKDVKFVLKFYQFIDLNTNYGLFALEKVDSNLQDFVMKSEPLTEQQVWFFFSQIIEGLIKIHSSGYVHRDLKPENILLNSYEVRIADFTTSKFIYEAEAEDTRLGTHGYISPEAGSKGIPNLYKYGYDIFSAGIIFFFLKFKEIPVIANLENCLDKKECTKEFKDLFNLLTLFDYSQRISVQSVKNDPWFINNNSSFYLSTKDNTPGRYNEINYKKISDKV